MASPIDDLIATRKRKLEKLAGLGVPAFPSKKSSGQKISVAREKELGLEVEIAGRVTAIRGHGKLTFVDLVDGTGKIQLALKVEKLDEKQLEIVELLDIGDFICVRGLLFTTQAGELTIDVSKLQLLTKSLRPLPDQWYGLKDVEERYRQRYIDLLLNPQVKRVFEIRSKVIKLLREKLDRAGFLEVETPVLQPLYGGATAKPFTTHHNALDIDLYLRISDELYLKRLIVGGFDKVYEIGKNFRNEGIDRWHNPEFTMLEFYWAYADYEDLMEFTQKILSDVVKEINGDYKVVHEGQEYNFTPPWPRLPFREIILQDTGIDIEKADTEERLLKEVKAKNLPLDLKGVVGYGALLDELYKKISRPNVRGPAFVIDYPYQMLPLAKKTADGKFAASFQLLAGGAEFIKAYNELNDPVDQKARWVEEMKLAKEGLEEHQVLDEDYVRALEYGMPPTAGWGMGVDRFIAFLTDQHGLKDVILFPTMRPE